MHEHPTAVGDPRAPAHEVRAGGPEAVRAIDEQQVDGAVERSQGERRVVPQVAHALGDSGARVPDGGRMLVHDAFSSIGVTLALLTATVPERSWRYLGRDGSLATYVRTAGPAAAPGLREVRELPWFAGNLARKALIAAGLRDGPWPH